MGLSSRSGSPSAFSRSIFKNTIIMSSERRTYRFYLTGKSRISAVFVLAFIWPAFDTLFPLLPLPINTGFSYAVLEASLTRAMLIATFACSGTVSALRQVS